MGERIIRPKSALTTSYVSGYASPYDGTGKTEDTDQKFSSSGGSADRLMMARKFTAPATGKIQSAAVILDKTGSPAGTVKAAIFVDKDGLPDYYIDGWSDAISASDLGSSPTEETFVWSDNFPELTASTAYWLVMMTTGYTFANGVTEIIWRTDADGDVAGSSCAKYIDTAARWTIIGADVGADLTLNYQDQIVNMNGKNRISIDVDYTKGSSTNVSVLVETSNDKSTWSQYTSFVVGVTEIAGKVPPFTFDTTGKYTIEIENINKPYVKISVKATDDATNAQVGITAYLN